jgi:hypothetical protein
VNVLQREGPSLGRPLVDTIKESRHLPCGEDPMLRPESTESIERAAAVLPSRDRPIPRGVVEEVVASIAAGEVARLVLLAETRAPQRWNALVYEVGEELAREPLLAGIATAAIEELLPPPLWLVVTREATSDAAPGPVDVLATLLIPHTIWSSSEAKAACARLRRHPLPEGLAAVQCFAQSKITAWHRDRARYVARPISRLLPIAEAPRTTSQLRDALELVRQRRGAAALCERVLLGAVARLNGLVPIAPSSN